MIKIDSQWKAAFDILMLFASCENTFSQAYQAAFGAVEPGIQMYVELYMIEGFFFLDLLFCFFQEYKDEETYTIISDVKKIAKHYVKGSFVFDLLAIIPIQELIEWNRSTSGGIGDINRLYKLLKLLRVPRLFELLNVQRIKQLVSDYYNTRLQQNVKKGIQDDGYPILKQLNIMQVYKIFRLIIVIFVTSYFLGILWHIYVCDLQVPPMNLDGTEADYFGNAMLGSCIPGEVDEKGIDRLIKVWYFALTTLSTIGYGDLSPVSIQERLLGAFILLIGVAVFSFIMGEFIEILMTYKSRFVVGQPKDLSKWIALLSRFNNGNPLNKEIISKIEDHFEYSWNCNRLNAVNTERDLQFMSELPIDVQS